ncbi:hypothetical protein J8L70_09900 [Pseudoalteromonas sp. MMG010]|uniref:hypothetical protein n=1 Tax=Pseudoalteromonas sp. MMG010 TaxID=2822685 RepID=UPI001B3A3DF5|nr:hypothetical protein [Pseudoalteromonas sp. MMG010]MBQ4833551.1 hypothetical protein [Pseudoalteromonas sp. MMG010]
MVLTRSRNYFQIFFASLSPMVVVVIVLAELNLGINLSLSILLVSYLISFIFWFKNGTKPAAWIKYDELHIRDGAFETDVINKNLVEYMRYETGHKRAVARRGNEQIDMHIMVIKMKGFDKWTLPIKDLVEHGANLRLYKFIKENFYNITLVKK